MNVLFFQTTKQGAVNRTLTHYADYDKALIGLYGGMRASINDENVVRVVGEVITDEGVIKKCERWAETPVIDNSEIEGVNE